MTAAPSVGATVPEAEAPRPSGGRGRWLRELLGRSTVRYSAAALTVVVVSAITVVLRRRVPPELNMSSFDGLLYVRQAKSLLTTLLLRMAAVWVLVSLLSVDPALAPLFAVAVSTPVAYLLTRRAVAPRRRPAGSLAAV